MGVCSQAIHPQYVIHVGVQRAAESAGSAGRQVRCATPCTGHSPNWGARLEQIHELLEP